MLCSEVCQAALACGFDTRVLFALLGWLRLLLTLGTVVYVPDFLFTQGRFFSFSMLSLYGSCPLARF